MRDSNVPTLDGRYWAAMLAASVLGTTAGDYVSNALGLGFAGALVPLAALFATALLVENRARRPNEAYYWVAIVVFRMTATNLGDFVSRTLHLGYGLTSVALGAVLAVFLVGTARASATARAAAGLRAARKQVPTTDGRYWTALLIASVFGTIAGDWFSADTGLGLARASLLLGTLLAAMLAVEVTAETGSPTRYWAVLAVVRTAGTCMGDELTNGIGLGFALGAALAAAVMVVILISRWLLTYPPEVVAAWAAYDTRSRPEVSPSSS